jgi:hypothetical protein
LGSGEGRDERERERERERGLCLTLKPYMFLTSLFHLSHFLGVLSEGLQVEEEKRVGLEHDASSSSEELT